MIRFQGVFSTESINHIRKTEALFLAPILLIPSIPIVLTLVLLLGPIWHGFWALPILAFLLSVIVGKRTYKKCGEATVTVDSDGIEAQSGCWHEYRFIEDIKKVKDCGNYYAISFFYPRKSHYFICQKDLLVEGTIKEFEEIVSDCLVRKAKLLGEQRR